MSPESANVESLVARVTDALGQQAELHIDVVKAEFARDTGALAEDLAPMAVGLPLVGLGYVFLCVGAALALASWLGSAGSAALLGAVNLLAGGLAVRLSLSRRRARREAPHVQ